MLFRKNDEEKAIQLFAGGKERVVNVQVVASSSSFSIRACYIFIIAIVRKCAYTGIVLQPAIRLHDRILCMHPFHSLALCFAKKKSFFHMQL